MPGSSYSEGDVASASPRRGKGGYLADRSHVSIASRRGAQGLARPVMRMSKMAVVIDFRGKHRRRAMVPGKHHRLAAGAVGAIWATAGAISTAPPVGPQLPQA